MFIGMYGFPSPDPCQQVLLHEFCDQHTTAFRGRGLAEASTMRAKTTRNLILLLGLILIIVTLGLTQALPVASQDADTTAKIATAMSAAPSTVFADASIYDLVVDDDGDFIVLREGSNRWSCLPVAPAAPSTDPMCLDATSMKWLGALMAKEELNTTVPGFAYKLQGGSDASNTDPLATEPAVGEEWLNSGPHIMLLLPGEIDQSVFSTEHDSDEPTIMWAGPL